MISNASAGGSRHLAVVFFDVLLLNDTCMLDVAYEERRRQLERVIQCSPGYVMLAERIRIDMKGRSADKVEAAFARRCAEFEGNSRARCASSSQLMMPDDRGVGLEGGRRRLQRAVVTVGQVEERCARIVAAFCAVSRPQTTFPVLVTPWISPSSERLGTRIAGESWAVRSNLHPETQLMSA